MQRLRLMMTVLVSTLPLFSATAGRGDTTPPGKERARKSGWHTSFSEAQAEAKTLGKPLVVHFYADWCGPCQQMERNVLNQPGVLRCLGADVVGVKINADHHADLRSRFGVSGYPSDVMVSPSGEVSTRYVGGTGESGYIARLKSEGAKYPSRSETRVAANYRGKSPKPAIAQRPGQSFGEPLGLDGYSPVALTTGKLWKKGKPEYATTHKGVAYHFSTADELELFQADPAAYSPKLLGCDPVILSESGRAVRGKTEHGVFFRNAVFLLANEANREQFLKNPSYYADQKFAVEVDEIEQYVSR